MHLHYLGGLLVEGIRTLNKDIIANCTFASQLLSRPTYGRVMELTDRFEEAALIEG